MSDDPTVPIQCEDCGTETAVALDEVADALASHNEQFHDGREVAEVDPAVSERLADLVAEEMGLLDGPD